MVVGSQVIRWGRHYELGIEQIDQQHEQLTNLLNFLYTEWRERQPQSALDATLARLVRAVRKHFRTEEQFMAKHRYARLSSHKAEHDSFAAEVGAFQRDFRAGQATLDEALLHHIANWLRNHLVVSDKPMAEAVCGGRGASTV